MNSLFHKFLDVLHVILLELPLAPGDQQLAEHDGLALLVLNLLLLQDITHLGVRGGEAGLVNSLNTKAIHKFLQ